MSKKDGEHCYFNIDCESNLCIANKCVENNEEIKRYIDIGEDIAKSEENIKEQKDTLESKKRELNKLQKQMEEIVVHAICEGF